MRNKRTLFWRTALRDLRGPRPEEPAGETVREERLRAVAGVEGGSALSSWRGRSGRRYVVAVHPAAGADAADWDGAVVLAVARGPEGEARLLATLCGDAPEARRRAWLAGALGRGACELHVHRLAETERRAVRADLATPRERAHAAQPRRARSPSGASNGATRGAGPGAARPARTPTPTPSPTPSPSPSRSGGD